MGHFIDLTGQKFGRLTVVRYLQMNERSNKKNIWLCQCECGNKIDVSSNHLTTLHTTSCGCLQRERSAQVARETKSMINKYEFCDDYVIGYTLNGQQFLFDKEYYDVVKQYCWRMNNMGYVVASDKPNGKKILYWLHHLVMNVSNDIIVDHIHGEASRYDNRKSNLRIATKSQNCMNRKKPSNNTSSVKGVRWHKATSKWQTSIGVNGKQIYLGVYSDFDEAVNARKEAEEKYFGEWSYENSQAM